MHDDAPIVRSCDDVTSGLRDVIGCGAVVRHQRNPGDVIVKEQRDVIMRDVDAAGGRHDVAPVLRLSPHSSRHRRLRASRRRRIPSPSSVVVVVISCCRRRVAMGGGSSSSSSSSTHLYTWSDDVIE